MDQHYGNVLTCPCGICKAKRTDWARKRVETWRAKNSAGLYREAPEPPPGVERNDNPRAKDDVITFAPRPKRRTDLPPIEGF